jgi:hypothetical protein
MLDAVFRPWKGAGMQRRDVLKMLAAGAAVPVFSSSLLGFFRAAQAQIGEGYKLRTLNAHQNDTVLAMIDQIIPATDTPGAKGARVNEFIDVILTEWATDDERERFLSGLADVDKRSNELFGKNFVGASAEQQVTLLRAMDEVAMAEPAAKPRHGNTVPEFDTHMKGSFFRVFKGITLHGYYTSEIGFAQELKLQIIPGALHGCQPLGPGIGEA